MITNSITQRSLTSNKPRIRRSVSLSDSLLVLHKTPNKPTEYNSTLVHEVRNPLCTINLALDMLKTTKLDEEQSQYISMITRGAERVNELINNLLLSEQIAKPRSGFHSLHQLLEEVLIMAKDRILLKKVAVCREYAATEHILLLDKEKIKIALTNIVINAIDAMPSEGGELKLTTKSIGGQTSIEIQDNGKGISKGNLARIFEPYFTNKPGGMGLGLSATLDILRANHASVDVRSEEGRGTCFMLSFCGK